MTEHGEIKQIVLQVNDPAFEDFISELIGADIDLVIVLRFAKKLARNWQPSGSKGIKN
jgi:hypothetical protein